MAGDEREGEKEVGWRGSEGGDERERGSERHREINSEGGREIEREESRERVGDG